LFVHPRIVGNPHGRYLSVGLLLSAVGAPFTPIVVSNVLFPTVQFGIFFPIVFFLSWLLRPQPRLWKLFTIAASYIFYVFAFRGGWFTWEKWRFPALLGLVTVLNQVFVVGTFRSNGRARRFWVTIAVVFDLGVLGYFKYYNFFRDNLGPLLSWLPKRQVVLPVAISFYIFQALSYVIDAYRGKVKPARLIDFATYLSFFPHLVAGPIVRASEFLPQMRERPDPRHLDAGRAFRLVMAGMFKKVVVASYLAKASVDKVFASPKSYGAIDTLVSVYAYAVQIYCDFSGYTDIAIGLALLLGVRFPKNFESPYIATSLQSFWRRWHMSLSRWLRDYLYIPLGGNRGSNLPGLRGRITPRAATYLNLSLVMLLGGLWHGAAVRFLIWGAIHGLGLAFERMRADQRGQANDAAPERFSVVGWLITFHVVCAAWIFFRAESLGRAGEMFARLVTGWGLGSTLVTPLLLLAIVGMLLAQFVPERVMGFLQGRFSSIPLVLQGVAMALGFFVIDKFGDVTTFIYFQF
jgi:alginate O-acetyltransferase complex protein AlgI